MKTIFVVAAAALMLSTGAAFAGEGGDQPVIYPVNHPAIDGAVAVAPSAENQSQMAWIESNTGYAAAGQPHYATAPQTPANGTVVNRNG